MRRRLASLLRAISWRIEPPAAILDFKLDPQVILNEDKACPACRIAKAKRAS